MTAADPNKPWPAAECAGSTAILELALIRPDTLRHRFSAVLLFTARSKLSKHFGRVKELGEHDISAPWPFT